MRYRVKLEYDGTDFAGFQAQAGLRTVQGEVEGALARIARSASRVAGAGRTDAGVHALGQVVSFDAETSVPTERLAAALNSSMARDVRAVEAEEAEEGFHARFSATARTYVYLLLNREAPSALLARYAWHVPYALDVAAMRAAAGRFVGTHDFAAWANAGAETPSTVRCVETCTVRRVRQVVLVRVEANAFLRAMVRNMVGALVEVGRGRIAPAEIDEYMRAGKRCERVPTAPARGLCLLRVRYDGERRRGHCGAWPGNEGEHVE